MFNFIHCLVIALQVTSNTVTLPHNCGKGYESYKGKCLETAKKVCKCRYGSPNVAEKCPSNQYNWETWSCKSCNQGYYKCKFNSMDACLKIENKCTCPKKEKSK